MNYLLIKINSLFCFIHACYMYVTLSWIASLVVLAVRNSPANAGRHKRCRFNPWVGKIPWRRRWQPTPVFLPGKSHGQREESGGLQSMGSQSVGRDWAGIILYLLSGLLFLSFFNSTHHLLKYEMMYIVSLSLLIRTKSPILTSDGLKCLEQCIAHGGHSKCICGMIEWMNNYSLEGGWSG